MGVDIFVEYRIIDGQRKYLRMDKTTGSIPGRSKCSSLRYNFQAGPGANPSSCLVDTWDFPGNKAT
jgi:hypothetical protein